jgi:peptidyl-dipeptidase Dcp
MYSRNSGFELHITNDELIWTTGRNYKPLFGEKPRKKGWIFTLDYPSYVPFVTYADNESYARRWLLLLAQGFRTMN